MKHFTKTLFLVALLGLATPVAAYYKPSPINLWIQENPKKALFLFYGAVIIGYLISTQLNKKQFPPDQPYFLDQSPNILPKAVQKRDESVIIKYSAKITLSITNSSEIYKVHTVEAPTFEEFKTALKQACKAFEESYYTFTVEPSVTFTQSTSTPNSIIKIKNTQTVYLQSETYTFRGSWREGLTVAHAAFAHTLQQFVLKNEGLYTTWNGDQYYLSQTSYYYLKSF